MVHPRLAKEVGRLMADADLNVKILYQSPEMDNFIFELRGPDDCCFEKSYFKIHCHIPEKYPFVPPVMCFMTKVWHPNVSSVTGTICLDILKDKWTPACNMDSALHSIISLLTDANPGDPQDWEPAKMYVEDRAGYEQKAREWVAQYAQQGMKTEKEALIEKVVKMGYAENYAHTVGNDIIDLIPFMINNSFHFKYISHFTNKFHRLSHIVSCY